MLLKRYLLYAQVSTIKKPSLKCSDMSCSVEATVVGRSNILCSLLHSTHINEELTVNLNISICELNKLLKYNFWLYLLHEWQLPWHLCWQLSDFALQRIFSLDIYLIFSRALIKPSYLNCSSGFASLSHSPLS